MATKKKQPENYRVLKPFDGYAEGDTIEASQLGDTLEARIADGFIAPELDEAPTGQAPSQAQPSQAPAQAQPSQPQLTTVRNEETGTITATVT